jgi:hypothetical protein
MSNYTVLHQTLWEMHRKWIYYILNSFLTLISSNYLTSVSICFTSRRCWTSTSHSPKDFHSTFHILRWERNPFNISISRWISVSQSNKNERKSCMFLACNTVQSGRIIGLSLLEQVTSKAKWCWRQVQLWLVYCWVLKTEVGYRSEMSDDFYRLTLRCTPEDSLNFISLLYVMHIKLSESSNSVYLRS